MIREADVDGDGQINYEGMSRQPSRISVYPPPLCVLHLPHICKGSQPFPHHPLPLSLSSSYLPSSALFLIFFPALFLSSYLYPPSLPLCLYFLRTNTVRRVRQDDALQVIVLAALVCTYVWEERRALCKDTVVYITRILITCALLGLKS